MRIMPRYQWVFALLLAAVTLLASASAANAASSHHRLVTCVIAHDPVESTTEGAPATVTIEGVQYTHTVDVTKIRENLRVYAPSRHCTYRGPFTRINETVTYQTETRTPVPPAGGNTVVVETITTIRTISTAHSQITSGWASITRQEVAAAGGTGTAYGPVSSSGAEG
jgi:hypothetical protein